MYLQTDLYAGVHKLPCRRGFESPQVDELIGSSFICSEIVSEYEQKIPQSQTADNPMAPRGRAAQPSRDTRETN